MAVRFSRQNCYMAYGVPPRDISFDAIVVVGDKEGHVGYGLGKANEVQDAIAKGIELIYQKLVKVLEGRGVMSFDTVGKEFSVEYHDALMQIPRTDVPYHTILEEVEKGYTLNDKVIRHAKVVVSSTPDESPTGTSGK